MYPNARKLRFLQGGDRLIQQHWFCNKRRHFAVSARRATHPDVHNVSCECVGFSHGLLPENLSVRQAALSILDRTEVQVHILHLCNCILHGKAHEVRNGLIIAAAADHHLNHVPFIAFSADDGRLKNDLPFFKLLASPVFQHLKRKAAQLCKCFCLAHLLSDKRWHYILSVADVFIIPHRTRDEKHCCEKPQHNHNHQCDVADSNGGALFMLLPRRCNARKFSMRLAQRTL